MLWKYNKVYNLIIVVSIADCHSSAQNDLEDT
jgi:hypothetical protein